MQKHKMEIILSKSEEYHEVLANPTHVPQFAQQASGAGPSTLATLYSP